MDMFYANSPNALAGEIIMARLVKRGDVWPVDDIKQMVAGILRGTRVYDAATERPLYPWAVFLVGDLKRGELFLGCEMRYRRLAAQRKTKKYTSCEVRPEDGTFYLHRAERYRGDARPIGPDYISWQNDVPYAMVNPRAVSQEMFTMFKEDHHGLRVRNLEIIGLIVGGESCS